MVLRVMLRMDGRIGVGYPPSMILLPLILAAAPSSGVDAAVAAYKTCVVSKAEQWATGTDSAQVIVKTAEEMCSAQRKALEDSAPTYLAMKRQEPEYANLTPSQERLFTEALISGTVEGARSVAYAKVLDTRSKKTP